MAKDKAKTKTKIDADKEQLNFRIDKELADWLRASAKAEGMASPGAYAMHILTLLKAGKIKRVG